MQLYLINNEEVEVNEEMHTIIYSILRQEFELSLMDSKLNWLLKRAGC